VIPTDSPNLLGAIVAATRKTLEFRRARDPLDGVIMAAERQHPNGGLFTERLSRPSGLNVIAECKRRSPSRGVLRADYDAAAIAERYEVNGAAAVSVLTEPAFFDGSLEDLLAVRSRVGVPLLRKDFIVDEYQLVEARAAGADAVLLIVAALEPDALRTLHVRATGLGLAALVEVHDRDELTIALDVGARVIGVNNRNLRTLEVTPSLSVEIIDGIPDYVVAVAESGLRDRADLCRLRDAGYDAFLVGERLVSAPDPGRALGELLSCS
jgi:indole-3-glycerol phosphate synthase